MISDDLRIHERWEGPWFHLPGSGTYCPGIVDCSQPSKVCRSIMKFFSSDRIRTWKSWFSLVFCVVLWWKKWHLAISVRAWLPPGSEQCHVRGVRGDWGWQRSTPTEPGCGGAQGWFLHGVLS
jgi:hypothetical protein